MCIVQPVWHVLLKDMLYTLVIFIDALDNPEAIISPQIKQMLLVLQARSSVCVYAYIVFLLCNVLYALRPEY